MKSESTEIDRAIVFSPRKAGTHLIQKLMICLGYSAYGESVPPADGRPALSMRQRVELANQFLHPTALASVDVKRDTAGFVRLTDRLFLQLGWVWQIRLAGTELSNVDLCEPGVELQVAMRPEVWTSSFSQTPPGLCWVFHSFDAWRMDRRFLHEWMTSEGPSLILNYRDPRDALVSMVNFFSGQSGSPFLRHPESAIFQPILASIADQTDRITYALTDPALPLLRDYESMVSLLRHPRVCKVSFEELVGPEGGGSRSQQVAAVGRVARHVGAEVDHESVCDSLFDRSSFTFHKGQVGAWREAFTARHVALFDARYGHLLELFGYE